MVFKVKFQQHRINSNSEKGGELNMGNMAGNKRLRRIECIFVIGGLLILGIFAYYLLKTC